MTRLAAMTAPHGRDTRPLRPFVRAQVVDLMAISPEGRTMSELQVFLITQRPASRDTISRVLTGLVAEGLLVVDTEPQWRRRVRASLTALMTRTANGKRRGLRGRYHLLYTPTRALHRELYAMRNASALHPPLTPETH